MSNQLLKSPISMVLELLESTIRSANMNNVDCLYSNLSVKQLSRLKKLILTFRRMTTTFDAKIRSRNDDVTGRRNGETDEMSRRVRRLQDKSEIYQGDNLNNIL
jgi:hypothetical protein